MKQKYWRAGILLVLLAITAGLLLYAFLPGNEGTPTLPPSTSAAVSGQTEPPYALRSFQGRVAAFEFGNPEPLEVLDVYVENLPEGDRAQLNSDGIPAADREALRRLIEDFGG